MRPLAIVVIVIIVLLVIGGIIGGIVGGVLLSKTPQPTASGIVPLVKYTGSVANLIKTNVNRPWSGYTQGQVFKLTFDQFTDDHLVMMSMLMASDTTPRRFTNLIWKPNADGTITIESAGLLSKTDPNYSAHNIISPWTVTAVDGKTIQVVFKSTTGSDSVYIFTLS